MIARVFFVLFLVCLNHLPLSAAQHTTGEPEVDAWLFSLPSEQIEPLDWREELKQIDEEIKEGEDLKNRYLAAARRAEDDGMRWQFMQNEKQEAKRAFERAENKREAARMLQARIDVLQARKKQLLQEHQLEQ